MTSESDHLSRGTTDAVGAAGYHDPNVNSTPRAPLSALLLKPQGIEPEPADHQTETMDPLNFTASPTVVTTDISVPVDSTRQSATKPLGVSAGVTDSALKGKAGSVSRHAHEDPDRAAVDGDVNRQGSNPSGTKRSGQVHPPRRASSRRHQPMGALETDIAAGDVALTVNGAAGAADKMADGYDQPAHQQQGHRCWNHRYTRALLTLGRKAWQGLRWVFTDLRRGVLAVGLMLSIILMSVPLDDRNYKINRTASIAVLMTSFWVTEVVPLAVTAMFPVVLFPLFGVASGKLIAGQYYNDIVFLLIGGSLIAEVSVNAGAAQHVDVHHAIPIRTLAL